jgi:hypothetical protein
MISASIMAAKMWKNSLKNVESDINKMLYETLFDYFLQRNGTYFLNNPRTTVQNNNNEISLHFKPTRLIFMNYSV